MRPRPFKQVNKFGAKRTNGYASKREAEYAAHLASEKAAGNILGWLEQVPIKLPGGKYVADFLVLRLDGTVRLVEVKGVQTAVWKLKLRTLEQTAPEWFALLEVVR